MGTSVNQSSPRTLNWRAAQAGYRDPSVPMERIASEIWRAALHQPTGNIGDMLAQPIVVQIGALVAESRSRVDLARKSAVMVARSKQSSLAVDIARRAAMQVFGSHDTPSAFTARLFAEATSYLVSRDLPGYVGRGRAHNVAESMQLKAQLASYVGGLATEVQRPANLNARSWPTYIREVVDHLRRSR